MKREAGEIDKGGREIDKGGRKIDKGAGEIDKGGAGEIDKGQGKLRMGEFGCRESRSLLPIGVTLMCSSEAWDRDSVCGQG